MVLLSFVGIAEKASAANYDSTAASHHVKENNTTAHHALSRDRAKEKMI